MHEKHVHTTPPNPQPQRSWHRSNDPHCIINDDLLKKLLTSIYFVENFPFTSSIAAFKKGSTCSSLGPKTIWWNDPLAVTCKDDESWETQLFETTNQGGEDVKVQKTQKNARNVSVLWYGRRSVAQLLIVQQCKRERTKLSGAVPQPLITIV